MFRTKGRTRGVERFACPRLRTAVVGDSRAAVEAGVIERRFIDRQTFFSKEAQGQNSLNVMDECIDIIKGAR